MNHRRSGIAAEQVRALVATGHQPVIPEPRRGLGLRSTTPVASRRAAEQDRRNQREHRDRKIERREWRELLAEQMAEVTIPVQHAVSV